MNMFAMIDERGAGTDTRDPRAAGNPLAGYTATQRTDTSGSDDSLGLVARS